MHTRVLADRFEVLEQVGEGGMGVVFRALDSQTGATVALKVQHAHKRHEAERFAREAETLASLRHPHVVSFVARGTLPSGEPYLAMEWLEGETLEARLSRGPLGLSDALAVAKQIASALAMAHRAGIVHRDLKPANVFLVAGDVRRLKLLDLGIARVASAKPLTNVSDVLGTPGYMAPEQIYASHDVTPAADVYALGCLLFRSLSGRLPFEGESRTEVMVRAAREDAPRLRSLVPSLPLEVDALVDTMLARAPAARPAHGAAALAALDALPAHASDRVVPGANRPWGLSRTALALLVAVPFVAGGATIAVLAVGAESEAPAQQDEPQRAARASETPCPEAYQSCADLRDVGSDVDDLYAALKREVARAPGAKLVLSSLRVEANDRTIHHGSVMIVRSAEEIAHGYVGHDRVLGIIERAPLAAEPTMRWPRCRPSQIVARARADGATGILTLTVSKPFDGRPWSVTGDAYQRRFSDDCSNRGSR